jgi:NADH:ubiquinone oxidoreductase subunit 3 (subunit A)
MSLMIKITIILSAGIILISYILSHKSYYPVQMGVVGDESERRGQYECGIEPFEEKIGVETRERFYLKFYKIGIIFLIFDLESLLLYPFTIMLQNEISYNQIYKSYIVFYIFILILVLGLIYEYRKTPWA